MHKSWLVSEKGLANSDREKKTRMTTSISSEALLPYL